MGLIGLVVFTLSLTLAPVAAEGQQAGKTYRIGVLIAAAPPPAPAPNLDASNVLDPRGQLLRAAVGFATLPPLTAHLNCAARGLDAMLARRP
jgi:hypothetical protein